MITLQEGDRPEIVLQDHLTKQLADCRAGRTQGPAASWADAILESDAGRPAAATWGPILLNAYRAAQQAPHEHLRP